MSTNTATKWAIDPNHSEVQFKTRHLAISNVAGTFKKFKGDVETANDNFDGAKINFEIETQSIYTNNEERDKHLRSPLFFDVQKFPFILFYGELLKRADSYVLEGALTIRDTQRAVVLQVEPTGTGTGRFGDIRAGFEVKGSINRKDYGLTWSMLTETGNLIVGEEIKLHFDIQLIKQVS